MDSVSPTPPPSQPCYKPWLQYVYYSMAISSFLTAPNVDFLYINLLADYQHPLTSSGLILEIRKCVII